MNTQTIRINPFDTFFFRDGKPFSMGEDTWADGVFPPAPSVIYGALRSLWISQQEGGFSLANIEASEALRIKSIFLEFNNNTVALPTPIDLVHKKGNDKHTLGLQPVSNKVITKATLSSVSLQNEVKYVDDFQGAFLRYRQFYKYLNNVFEKLMIEKDFIVDEGKVGIGREFGTRTVRQSSLYRVEMKRFINENRPAIVVEFAGLDFLDQAIIKIGGEGKAGSAVLINDKKYTEVKPLNLKCNYFKLYFSTPAIFNNVVSEGENDEKHLGWLPRWINPKSFEGVYKGLKVKLHSVVLGKPVSVGGFDVKLGEPKVMYKAVPAGSVYYFELLEGNNEKIINTFHKKSISEYKAKEGFGITYVGKWK